MHEVRCARAGQCEDREAGVDPTTGKTTEVGAVTTEDAPLCPTCVRFVRYALGSLPLDVAELTHLMAPSMQVRYRDPQIPDQPRVKLSAPAPMNLQAEALRAYIANETVAWAEAVAVETGGEWDTEWAPTTRLGYRVQFAATLLDDNVLSLIALAPARRRTYSTGVDAADGHDQDEATAHGGYVLTTRDGTDAAITFLRIHEQVRGFAGRIPSDRLQMPCPRCHQRNMHREHFRALGDGHGGDESQGRVVCRTCWAQWTDTQYEDLRAATARAFGVPL